jgi:hypothetical protein
MSEDDRRVNAPKRKRTLREVCIDTAALIGAMTVVGSFFFGALGISLTDNTDRVNELYRRDSARVDSLRLMSGKIGELNRKMDFSIYLNCELYARAYPNAPRQQLCPRDDR